MTALPLMMVKGRRGSLVHAEKKALRMATWAALKAAGGARFPGARGRIPNFVGAEAAAHHLIQTPEWVGARMIKCNPDLPQRPVRHAALKAGKTIFMAVPKLAKQKPFIKLDPKCLSPKDLWSASSIKGSAMLGRPVHLDEMPQIDLIVTGCVAVSADGVRLGKGGGYSDLEYGLLKHFNKIGAETVVMTSIHPTQFLPAGTVPRESHDVAIDMVAMLDGTKRLSPRFERPSGILWPRLEAEKRANMPVFDNLFGP